MTTSPENFGSQFSDIIGKNFSPGESSMMAYNASRDAKEHNLSLLPPDIIRKDSEGSYVLIRSGHYTHLWDGGQYISHRQGGFGDGLTHEIGATPVPPGPLSHDELLGHIRNWHESHKDWLGE